MLLNRAVRFMARFNLAIENMARFKYVQEGSKKEQINDDIIIKYYIITSHCITH